MRVVWTLRDENGALHECLLGPHEDGGVRVLLAVNGVPMIGRRCADEAEADYVVRAWHQDTSRGLAS